MISIYETMIVYLQRVHSVSSTCKLRWSLNRVRHWKISKLSCSMQAIHSCIYSIIIFEVHLVLANRMWCIAIFPYIANIIGNDRLIDLCIDWLIGWVVSGSSSTLCGMPGVICMRDGWSLTYKLVWWSWRRKRGNDAPSIIQFEFLINKNEKLLTKYYILYLILTCE